MDDAMIWGTIAAIMTVGIGIIAVTVLYENRDNFENWVSFIDEWWAERDRRRK